MISTRTCIVDVASATFDHASHPGQSTNSRSFDPSILLSSSFTALSSLVDSCKAVFSFPLYSRTPKALQERYLIGKDNIDSSHHVPVRFLVRSALSSSICKGLSMPNGCNVDLSSRNTKLYLGATRVVSDTIIYCQHNNLGNNC